MTKTGFDVHAFIGVLGISFSGAISLYSTIMGALAATATAAYMGLRAYGEWRKVKSLPVKSKQSEFDL
jgi:hypothetical protein